MIEITVGAVEGPARRAYRRLRSHFAGMFFPVRGEVGLIGCVAVKARVGPAAIVEVKIPADRSTSFADAVVGAQIHLLVFDAAPEPLDKHVVAPGAFAVHADGYAIAGERAGGGLASELRALVGVEYLRLAVARQGVLQRLDAERRLHRNRPPAP